MFPVKPVQPSPPSPQCKRLHYKKYINVLGKINVFQGRASFNEIFKQMKLAWLVLVFMLCLGNFSG